MSDRTLLTIGIVLFLAVSVVIVWSAFQAVRL